MGKGAPKQPSIIFPPEPRPPEIFKPEEIDIAEQKRRARISSSKSLMNTGLLGASSDSDTTTLLKKNILGV